MSTDWLQTILATKREEVIGLKARRAAWRDSLAALPPATRGRFRKALAAVGFQVLAEIKRASPSRGLLAPDLDAGATARAYRSGGAAALSVLTDNRYFLGSAEDLRAARAASGLPVLRKDFLIDPVQVEESRILEADAVLLIAAALPGRQLGAMLEAVEQHGLDALVETHDAVEIERALEAGASIIGVNSRDLRTFQVDRAQTAKLCSLLPRSVVRVAESGIRTVQQAREMRQAGYDAILVGEGLVQAGDKAKMIRELRQ